MRIRKFLFTLLALVTFFLSIGLTRALSLPLRLSDGDAKPTVVISQSDRKFVGGSSDGDAVKSVDADHRNAAPSERASPDRAPDGARMESVAVSTASWRGYMEPRHIALLSPHGISDLPNMNVASFTYRAAPATRISHA